MDASAYLSQLQALLPTGLAWPREPAATLTSLLDAWAQELARVDARAEQLLSETDPAATSELLPDWERVAGLPNVCVLEAQTTSQRRAALLEHLTNLGAQSRAWYIEIAGGLGYTITITEFDSNDVDDDVSAPIQGDAWQFAWQVNAGATTVWTLTVDDTVADPLAAWGNSGLECLINRLKPAHTTVLYSYT
jgi:uncharacterized protein YmfQ (DUF2313 family)